MERTVLVADDDVNARIIAETLLGVRGLSVRCAGDGTEVLAILRREPIAVVVLEPSLPGMNGFELLRRLQGRFGPPRLPTAPRILVVTDRHEPEIERFALRLGADAFLRKPVAPGPFIATVERLLDGSPGVSAFDSSAPC